ncbi:MAG TPA: hypothetical protein VFL80_02820 [Thermoanaerobaculia bacterium]|nr:hypothetical protein [Thermoanaerobaculia bacterium]
MTELVTAAPATRAAHDKSAALRAIGVAQILLGLLLCAVVFGIAAATEVQQKMAGAPAFTFAGNLVLYSALALYFFAAGSGALRRRRWARPVTLAVSGVWLALGAVITALALAIVPRYVSNFRDAALAIGTLALLHIVIPSIFIALYRNPAMRETLEAHDPVSRWTDRVPVPVLALSLLMGFSAVSLLTGASYAVIPLFGTTLSGAPAAVVSIALAGLLGWVAFQLYRLRRSAWWTVLLLQLAAIGGGAATFLRAGPEGVFRSPLLWMIALAAWGGFFLFLMYARRYFSAPSPRTRAEDLRVAA